MAYNQCRECGGEKVAYWVAPQNGTTIKRDAVNYGFCPKGHRNALSPVPWIPSDVAIGPSQRFMINGPGGYEYVADDDGTAIGDFGDVVASDDDAANFQEAATV